MLAQAQKELGVDISDEAITQMSEHIEMTDKDFEVAAAEEKKVKFSRCRSAFGVMKYDSARETFLYTLIFSFLAKLTLSSSVVMM
jgi:hypothetical protein